MTKHGRIYLDALGLDATDFIASEISGQAACDLHHIDCRGMGGTKKEDRIENLIALSREEHDRLGDKKQFMFYLYAKHYVYLESCGVSFNRAYMLAKMDEYSVFAQEQVA